MEDFSKVYGLSEADYLRLKPFIRLVEPKTPLDTVHTSAIAEVNEPKEKIFEKIILDINLAAAEEWQLLRGIGPAYAKRIVEFRENLGGFHHIEQIAEVWGLPDSTFQKIRPNLELTEVNLHQLNLNSVDVKALQKHPYLKWKQAQIIINYRDNHGDYSSLDDLYKIRAFDSLLVQKISPYLKIE